MSNKIQITKAELVSFFVALGLPKAANWDNEKLAKKFTEIPKKVTAEDVPDDFKGIFEDIKNGALEFTPEEEAGESKSEKKAKKADKSEKSGKEEKSEKKKDKKEKADKPEKSGKKKDKKEKKEKKEIERDAWGSRPGSIRALVNATWTKDWKTDVAIAKEAGVTLKQARSRLRRAKRKDLVEVRRTIEYKLAEGKKSKSE